MDAPHDDQDHIHDHDMSHAQNEYCVNTTIAIWLGINALILLSTIPLIYKFIKAHIQNQNRKKSQWYLFYPGIAFALITFIVIISDTVSIVFYSCNHLLWMIFMLVFAFTYTLQIILVLTIFFCRVYFVFKASIYQMSKATIAMYAGLFIVTPILVATAAFRYKNSHQSSESSKTLAVCYLINMCIMLSLEILFAMKLCKLMQTSGQFEASSVPSMTATTVSVDMTQSQPSPVSVAQVKSVTKKKNTAQTNQAKSFMSVITRTVVLTAISITFTLVACVGFILLDQSTEMGQIIVALLVIIDVYTNFICVVLSYQYFTEYYYKLFGCLDAKCTQLFTVIARSRSSQSVPPSTPRVRTPSVPSVPEEIEDGDQLVFVD